MYIKKETKVLIIKWYIRKYIQYDGIDLNNIHDLKELENIIRTQNDIFGEVSECKACYFAGRDYCPKCGECKSWHWDKNITETKDNYAFPYGYYLKFYEHETNSVQKGI